MRGQNDSGTPVFIQKAAIKALEMYGDDGSAPADVQSNKSILREENFS